MNLPTTDLDRLLEAFRRLPPELQRQVLEGLERLGQGEPGELSRLVRLAASFGQLSPDVRIRVVDAVEALQQGDLASYSRQATSAMEDVRRERRCARLLVIRPEWGVESLRREDRE